MSDYLVTDAELTAIADAIRTKGGTSTSLSFPTEFVSAINAISGGGGLEYEEGTFEPTSNTNLYSQWFPFSNTHTNRPSILIFQDTTLSTDTTASLLFVCYVLNEALFGGSFYTNTTNLTKRTGTMNAIIRYNTYTSTTEQPVDNNDTPYNDGIKTNGFYLRMSRNALAGHTYKWIAIWK